MGCSIPHAGIRTHRQRYQLLAHRHTPPPSLLGKLGMMMLLRLCLGRILIVGIILGTLLPSPFPSKQQRRDFLLTFQVRQWLGQSSALQTPSLWLCHWPQLSHSPPSLNQHPFYLPRKGSHEPPPSSSSSQQGNATVCKHFLFPLNILGSPKQQIKNINTHKLN